MTMKQTEMSSVKNANARLLTMTLPRDLSWLNEYLNIATRKETVNGAEQTAGHSHGAKIANAEKRQDIA